MFYRVRVLVFSAEIISTFQNLKFLLHLEIKVGLLFPFIKGRERSLFCLEQ